MGGSLSLLNVRQASQKPLLCLGDSTLANRYLCFQFEISSVQIEIYVHKCTMCTYVWEYSHIYS